jgi:hypothetical protein
MVGARLRAGTWLLLQLVALYVGHEAYLSPDTSATISDLALKSNLGQIIWIAGVTAATLWEIRDITSKGRIERAASFMPTRRPTKARRPRDVVEVED